jgi:hypothetical protein
LSSFFCVAWRGIGSYRRIGACVVVFGIHYDLVWV